MYVCVFVCGQSCGSVLPVDKWLDSLSVSQTPQVRIPLNVPSFFFFSLTTSYTCNLLVCTYTCVGKLVTWGVGPDVNYFGIVIASLVCMQPSQTNLPHADTVSDPCWGILNWERDSVKCDHSTFNNIV